MSTELRIGPGVHGVGPEGRPRGDLERGGPAGGYWHGIDWSLLRLRDGARARRLAELVEGEPQPDPRGVDEAWGLVPPEHRHTAVRGIVRERPSRSLPSVGAGLDPAMHLEAAVAAMADAHPHAALALGGGIDAAAVLVAWHAVTGGWPAVVTVRTGVQGYDEVDTVEALCRELGASLEVVEVPAASLEALLPLALRAAECPLYGWHPVVRLGLSRAVHRRGHGVLVTGDGADAIARGRADLDYVPVVAALTRAAGLRLRSPFVEAAVVSAGLEGRSDPDKGWLRAYLRRRGAPSWLVQAPKRARRLPWPSPDPTPYRSALRGLAEALGRPLRLDTDRERLSWLTLHWLLQELRGGAR